MTCEKAVCVLCLTAAFHLVQLRVWMGSKQAWGHHSKRQAAGLCIPTRSDSTIYMVTRSCSFDIRASFPLRTQSVHCTRISGPRRWNLTSSPKGSTVRMVSLSFLTAPLSAVLSASCGLLLVSSPGKVSTWMAVAWLTAAESVGSLAGWSEVDRDLLREERACTC